jgi:hypothetical protein
VAQLQAEMEQMEQLLYTYFHHAVKLPLAVFFLGGASGFEQSN